MIGCDQGEVVHPAPSQQRQLTRYVGQQLVVDKSGLAQQKVSVDVSQVRLEHVERRLNKTTRLQHNTEGFTDAFEPFAAQSKLSKVAILGKQLVWITRHESQSVTNKSLMVELGLSDIGNAYEWEHSTHSTQRKGLTKAGSGRQGAVNKVGKARGKVENAGKAAHKRGGQGSGW